MTTVRDGPPLELRRLEAGDWPRVVDIAWQGLDPSVAAYGFPPAPHRYRTRLRSRIRRLIRPDAMSAGHSANWLCRGTDVCGFAILEPNPPELHLAWIVLLPACQGTGVAIEAMGLIEQEARRSHCSRITLFVDRRNHRAIRFYLRNHFSFSGRSKYMFIVSRRRRPEVPALLDLPRWAIALAFGSCSAPVRIGHTSVAAVRYSDGTLALGIEEGRTIDPNPILDGVFSRTFASRVRLTSRAPLCPRGAALEALCHEMVKDLMCR